MRRFGPLLSLAVVVARVAFAQAGPADARAGAVIDQAVAAMGGESALRAIQGVRLDVMTQWQRTVFGDHPYADQPSYEHNVELRDYSTRSWRNTREFFGNGPVGTTITVVVRDTVAAVGRRPGAAAPTTWGPLSVAYVDERRELFTFAPERVLLIARSAPDLRLLADTTIDGVAHARLTATLDGYPATLFVRRTDRLPAFVRFRADETNDMGLAPWAVMDVEFWYSAWQRVPPGVLLPRQRDVRRVGRPYKRMTALTIALNPAAPADSFAIPDSLVTAFFARQNKPMWDVPLDSARIVADHFATFGLFVGAGGAVKIGGRWVLLEMGQAAGATDRISKWLERTTPGVPIGAAIATRPGTGNGGITWLADHKIPLITAAGFAPFAGRMLGGGRKGSITVVAQPRWLKVATDSLWLEPLDLPDAGGSLAVYSPTHHWLYALTMGAPVFQADQTALIARLRARGWPVEWLGSIRAIAAPADPAT